MGGGVSGKNFFKYEQMFLSGPNSHEIIFTFRITNTPSISQITTIPVSPNIYFLSNIHQFHHQENYLFYQFHNHFCRL